MRLWECRIESGDINGIYCAYRRKQRLIDHLDGTAKLAGKFAESFGKYEWGYCIGMLHDLGKYSKEFQHRIQFNTNDRVDHSTAGMRLCNEKGGYYSILQYAIAGHHSGLMDYYKLEERYRKSICDYQAYRHEVEIPKIKSDPFESCKTQNPHFSMGNLRIRSFIVCLQTINQNREIEMIRAFG